MRGMWPADFPSFAALWLDPEVTARVGVPARDEAESWGSFLRNAGSWVLLGYGQWAICDRTSGEFLGHTGIFRAMRGHGADFDGAPEAGWVLARAAQGRGIGTEAVRAMLAWVDASDHAGALVAQIDHGNAASLALAARMGFRRMRDVAGGERGLALLRRPGPQEPPG
ncbi:GNAT family N-acetyltransferase [Alitabrizicola rongguiensis]|uniref:GNAT family N-acetyltransferase n=1 Tax=Alitabrizicola rongguiensis TaxID=2909234 RepID=UPI002104BE69|nr:GNAT family N-acetyltransferase [Tabrizicola rongguiensis]